MDDSQFAAFRKLAKQEGHPMTQVLIRLIKNYIRETSETMIIILFILFLMGCSKEPEPCKCAEFTNSGWGIPSIHYIGYWQELTFCSGKKTIWLCPDPTWILDPTHCWQELPEIEIPLKHTKP